MIFNLTVRNNNETETFSFTNCHQAKSVGGTMFYYDDDVEQVSVIDSLGNTYLFLDKITKERISVPSEEANKALISVL